MTFTGGNSKSEEPAGMMVVGTIVSNNIDLVSALSNIGLQIENLRKSIDEMNEKLESVYYAPGMPGADAVAAGWFDRIESIKNNSNALDSRNEESEDAESPDPV
jgi:hypothetical protein